jgi:hypothetical protein
VESLSSKNLELAGRGFGYATGGNSYPDVDILTDSDGSWVLLMLTQGAFPLFDVEVTLVDLDELRAHPMPHGGSIKEQLSWRGPYKTIRVGTLHPRKGEPLWTVGAPGISRNLNLAIEARNGVFVEFIRGRLVAGTWKRARIVYRSVGEDGRTREVLCAKIDPGFPRSDNGRLWWDTPEDEASIAYKPDPEAAPRCHGA